MPRRTAGTLVVIAFCAYAHPPQLVSVQVADARVGPVDPGWVPWRRPAGCR